MKVKLNKWVKCEVYKSMTNKVLKNKRLHCYQVDCEEKYIECKDCVLYPKLVIDLKTELIEE